MLDVINKGCQSILGADGEAVFLGEWNSALLYKTLTDGDDAFWRGKRVLDIGANTCGLSVEIARRGADVIALEPDPYNNCFAKSQRHVDEIVRYESLQLKVVRKGLFDAQEYKGFDVVLCLGLLYHFRYPQLVLDYLSTLEMEWLFLGTQVSPGESLTLMNRVDQSIPFPQGFYTESTVLSGWHPTRSLLEKMLEWAGFTDVVSLTDTKYSFPSKPVGLTNSAYYRCRRTSVVDPSQAMAEYYPR